MVTTKTKKNRRKRGSRTQGWGLVHRGSGQKGGVGRAGGGKKCHGKKDMFGPNHLGRHGFKRGGADNSYKVISIKDLSERLEGLIEEKLVEKKGDTYHVDLSKLGYGKLLSQGEVNKKLEIKVERASAKTKQKIEGKGGKLILEHVSVERNTVQPS